MSSGNYYGGPPPQGHSPQPGYGYAPPPGQYAPQGQYPPPQGPYPPPQQQPGYGTPPPQGQYPPQGRYGPPSPQPPHAQYGVPSAPGYPPQQMQQYPPYPPGQYPPPQPGYGPPPGQYPPQQQYGGPVGPPSGPPAPASPGYIPGQMAVGDASRDADALRKAMKGLGTDDTVLIRILSKPDPLQIELLKDTYTRRIQRNLEKDVESETSGNYRKGLLGLVYGPLRHDVECLHDALDGAGTKEAVLNDVLLGRSNADMKAIKDAYLGKCHHSLESKVRGDLSGLTKELFNMAMAGKRAEESTPVHQQATGNDVRDLKEATKDNDVNQLAVCSILTSRSDQQLRAICQSYPGFEAVIQKRFWGHMRDALLTIWCRAKNRESHDAEALNECMSGIGLNREERLVQRIVRLHWDRQHLNRVKSTYSTKFQVNLTDHIRKKTSGDCRQLLLAMIT